MQVIVTPNALRQYEHFQKSDQIKIRNKLLLLEKHPLEGKKLAGKLAEIRSLRAWPYRILYYVNKKERKVFIVTIAHRQGVYR